MQFSSWEEIFSQLENSPCWFVSFKSNSQVLWCKICLSVFQFISFLSVNSINCQSLLPFSFPFFSVQWFDCHDKFNDQWWNSWDISIVFWCEMLWWCQQFNNCTQCNIWIKNMNLFLDIKWLWQFDILNESITEIMFKDLLDCFEIFFFIVDKDTSFNNSISDTLWNFWLSSTRNCAWLVAHCVLWKNTSECPSSWCHCVVKNDCVTIWKNIIHFWNQKNLIFLSFMCVFNWSFFNIENWIFFDINNSFWEFLINSISFWLNNQWVFVSLNHFVIFIILWVFRTFTSFSKIIRWSSNSSSSMFFFSKTIQISRIWNLCFHFLLAISKVIISNNCANNTRSVSSIHFESITIIIQFIFSLPAHSFFLLSFCSLRNVWKTTFFLCDLCQMRSKNSHSSMTSPSKWIQSSIILSKFWISSITKNTFNKIKTTNHISRNKEMHFCAFFMIKSFDTINSWNNNWSHIKWDIWFCWILTISCVWNDKMIFWSFIKCSFKHSDKCTLWTFYFVSRHWNVSFTNMEDSNCCSFVFLWIVKDSLFDFVWCHCVTLELISIWWEW